jgi:hypothetical protein
MKEVQRRPTGRPERQSLGVAAAVSAEGDAEETTATGPGERRMTHHQETKTGLSSKHGGIGLSKFKFGIGAVIATLLLAFGAFGLGASTPTADADITDVFVSTFPFETEAP